MRLASALLLLTGAAHAADRIGGIEFFGYKGLDLESIRKTLPVKPGDTITPQLKHQLRDQFHATDVESVCCDENHSAWLFIGLAGQSSRTIDYLLAPKGDARVSPELARLSKKREAALKAAVHKGGEAAEEDDSAGYAVSKDPGHRLLDLQLRAYALEHEAEIMSVLGESSSAEDRAIAAEALGYAKQSPAQIAALIKASRDSDDDVRNNASRALGVLAASSAETAALIDPAPFIDMIGSGVWTDRNKGSFVLMELTKSRDPKILNAIQSRAMDALQEMAAWHDTGHAMAAQLILGRIAGKTDVDIYLSMPH